MASYSVLADPLVLETILVTLAKGGTIKQAAALTRTSARSIHRHASKTPEFRRKLTEAQEEGNKPGKPGPRYFSEIVKADKERKPDPTPLVEQLLPDIPAMLPSPPESALPELVDLPPNPPRQPREARKHTPSPAIEAEIVSTKRTSAEHPESEWSETDQQHLANRGDASEEAVAAYYWRVMHDRREPVAMRVTAMKALHDFKMVRARASRLEELAGIGRPRVDMQDRERGLTTETVDGWRHAIIGPPPPPKETDD